MAFRNIIIENPARISVKNEQLVISTGSDHSLSPEDISSILIESRQSTITTAALSLLGQRVVTAKINNQSECLRICGKTDEAKGLSAMADTVRSGDTGNVEAAAAARYFPALFGRGFTRSLVTGINSALNYGYAILRGCMARYLAVYGFLPAYGLHHKSELNSFNLADDMMEPFRPVIDLMVFSMIDEADDLTPDKKRLLFNCLNLDVRSGGQRHSVAYAMERTVHSLQRSFTTGEAKLILPELLELKQHSYE